MLNRLAAGMADTAPLGPKEEHLLALAQGWAHGTTHLFFFYYRRALPECTSRMYVSLLR